MFTALKRLAAQEPETVERLAPSVEWWLAAFNSTSVDDFR
jgi:hypothetical protein